MKFILLVSIIAIAHLFIIYRIFSFNLLVGGLLLIETVLLYLSTQPDKNKSSLIRLSLILLIFSLGLYILRGNLDKNLFTASRLEEDEIAKRHEYYSDELGKVYRNKFGLFYFDKFKLVAHKVNVNLFANMDLGLYFNSNYSLYTLLLIPFFFVGLINLILQKNMTLVLSFCLSLVFEIFLVVGNRFGSMLLLPFINLCVFFGIIKSFAYLASLKAFKNPLT